MNFDDMEEISAWHHHDKARKAFRDLDWVKAEEETLRAIKSAPTEVTHYLNMGAIKTRQGNIEQAISIYAETLKLHPLLPEALRRIGALYLKLSDFEAAKNAYIAVLLQEPANVLAHEELGLTYFLMGDFEKSINCFKQSISHSSNLPRTYYRIGMAYFGQGDLNSAHSAFEKSLLVQPDFEESKKMLDQVNFLLGIKSALFKNCLPLKKKSNFKIEVTLRTIHSKITIIGKVLFY